MAYSVRYVNGKYLSQIRKEWEELQLGEDMTMFQSYPWFQMLQKKYIPQDTNKFESVFAVVESEDKPCMIAPLWIVKKTFRILNQKGVYLLGRRSFSDYLNFVYHDFDGEAFDFLLNDLSEKYGVKYVTIEDIRESTSLYRHVLNNYKVYINKERPCVRLVLPSSVEEYNHLLSKNSRQNIRTANNRLKKDGKELIYNFNDQQVDRNLCLALRESKLSAKELPLWYIYKYRILNRLRYRFNGPMPIKDYPESRIMSAHDGDGKLRAFFNYGYDMDRKRIRVMAAGTDLTFARYSPGMLLMYNYITNAIEEGNLLEVDFTRGDEKYKFSLGGQQNNNHTIKFKIKA